MLLFWILCTERFYAALSVSWKLYLRCIHFSHSAFWPGVHRMLFWRGEGKGSQPTIMFLSVLMMLSRCLILCEQMGLLCRSAFPACYIVFQPLPACLCFNVFVYWAQWQTVWCRILLYCFVVPAVSAIIFIMPVAVFPLLHTSRKRNRSARLDVHSRGFGCLVTHTVVMNDIVDTWIWTYHQGMNKTKGCKKWL